MKTIMDLSEWDNAAWRVTRPTKVYQKLGWADASGTWVGSSKMLSNVYREVELVEGDAILALCGGEFALRMGETEAFPIVKKISEKHPFEKTYGCRHPFHEEWGADDMGLVKLPVIPACKVTRPDSQVTLPPGSKRIGRNIDYVIP